MKFVRYLMFLTQANFMPFGFSSFRTKNTRGDITATGAALTAGKTLNLDAARDIMLQASKSSTHSDAKNNSWGVEVGVGVSIGAQIGVYVYFSANVANGKSVSDTTSYNNTHLTADTINLTSGGNTTLRGADATANTINADVGGKLAVESLQDTAELSCPYCVHTAPSLNLTIFEDGVGQLRPAKAELATK